MSETFSLVEATMKVIQDRRSIREFTDEPVSDKDLDLLLEAARQAPSGENAQALMPFLCPFKIPVCSPDEVSHSRMVISEPAEAIILPSGEKTHKLTVSTKLVYG